MKLLSIAALCPLEAGKAVYKARSLYALVKDTAFVDACNGFAALERIDNGALQMTNTEKGKSVSFDTKSSIHVYPNPIRTQLNIRYQIAKDARLVIYNLYGQEITTSMLSKGTDHQVLDVSNFTNGMYMLWVNNEIGEELLVQKIIISK